MSAPRVDSIDPPSAIEGGRLAISGSGFLVTGPHLPEIHIGAVRARVVYASPTRLAALVPPLPEGGPTPIRIEGVAGETAIVNIGAPFAMGLHQVDNPVFD